MSALQRHRAAHAELGSIGAELRANEVFWRDRYHFFKARGYTLRPRYHPSWVPSWKADADMMPILAEDFWHAPERHVIDARSKGGALVCIKAILTRGSEMEITMLFNQLYLRDDPRNHGITFLDTFSDERDSNISYIVMPFLRAWDDPQFDMVSDVIDFVDQIIEGLAFMHEHHVAHRNCGVGNILMDPQSMYPKGFHPVFPDKLPNFQADAPHHTRLTVSKRVKYYFVDFGMSVRIPPGQPPLVYSLNGIDQDVPELSDHIPYDPFKADIFMIGNLLRRELYNKYMRLPFLRPLIYAMLKLNPDDRSSAEDALRRWQVIRGRIPIWQRLSRLCGRDEGTVRTYFLDVVAAFKMSFVVARELFWWTLGWPLIALR